MKHQTNSDTQVDAGKTFPPELNTWKLLKFWLLFFAIIGGLVVGMLGYGSYSVAINAASRIQSRNNLKTIGQAILHYKEEHQHFPESSIKDSADKPLLSWRVELLPYLGYRELYDQFDLTQPWNSETNKQLISQMPELFQCPEMDSGEFKTNYLFVVGKETVFTPEGFTQLHEIRDATTNTTLAIEADETQAVIWTRPVDLNYDPVDPFKGFPQMRNGLGLFLMADGSVQIVNESMNEEVYKALMTKAGEENLTFGESFGI